MILTRQGPVNLFTKWIIVLFLANYPLQISASRNRNRYDTSRRNSNSGQSKHHLSPETRKVNWLHHGEQDRIGENLADCENCDQDTFRRKGETDEKNIHRRRERRHHSRRQRKHHEAKDIQTHSGIANTQGRQSSNSKKPVVTLPSQETLTEQFIRATHHGKASERNRGRTEAPSASDRNFDTLSTGDRLQRLADAKRARKPIDNAHIRKTEPSRNSPQRDGLQRSRAGKERKKAVVSSAKARRRGIPTASEDDHHGRGVDSRLWIKGINVRVHKKNRNLKGSDEQGLKKILGKADARSGVHTNRHKNRRKQTKTKPDATLQQNSDKHSLSRQNTHSGAVADSSKSGYVSDAEWDQDRRDSVDWNRLSRLGRPSAADRYEQRLSSDFHRNYQELMDHINAVVQNLQGGMDRLESGYKQLYNVSRYEIIADTRDIIDGLIGANHRVYDTVVSITNYARRVMMRKHGIGVGAVRSPAITEKSVPETKFDKRNFDPQLDLVYGEQRKVEEDMRDVNGMKLKCMQDKSRAQQVRELYSDKYDRPTIKDVYDNLNITIIRINNAVQYSASLRRRAGSKVYLAEVKGDMDKARGILRNSSSIVDNGIQGMRGNYYLYKKWQDEKRHRSSTGNRSGFWVDSSSSLSPDVYQELLQLVSLAKRHSNEIKDQQRRMDNILMDPISKALTEIASQSGGGTSVSGQSLSSRLTMLTKELYASLDQLRLYIGSKAKLTYPKKCRTNSEGSGREPTTDNDDDDEMCDEELGSGTGDDNKEFVTSNDEDFIFIAEPTDGPVRSMNQFGQDLTDFTAKVLSDSQRINDAAQNLHQSLEGLQQKWKNVQSKVADMKRGEDLQKQFISNLNDKARNFQEVKSRMRQISLKVEDLKKYNLDNVIREAQLALEHAKERTERKTTPAEIEVTRKPTEGYDVTPAKEKTDVTDKPEEKTDKIEKPEDDVNYSELLRKGKEIMSNRDDIRLLKSMAIESCGKIGSHFTHARGNMSLLRQKVDKARQMLTTLQMSISKSGSGYIPVPIPQTQSEASQSAVSSIQVCIKPKTLDGTVFMVKGNNSASYGLTLDSGEASVTVYDEDLYDLDTITLSQALVTKKWYTLEMQRTGTTVTVKILSQDGETETGSKQISSVPFLQPLPHMAYIGNVPESLSIGGESWEGCIGDLSVNGRILTLYRPDNNDKEPTLCTDHCAPESEKLSMVFSGHGFVHFDRPERETMEQVTMSFKTRQKMASLLYVVNRASGFYLSVVMHSGAVKVESLPGNEVLLSLNSSLNDGQSHFLKIIFRGGRTYPELDGNRAAFSVERGTPKIFRDVKEGVLIGAIVSDDRRYKNEQYRPLVGCVGDISVNEDGLSLPDAAEVYNSYLGHCNASNRHIWFSCWQWTDVSKSLSLGVVENSNSISLLVSRDAGGPLLYYSKEDSFDIEVSLTADGIDVSSDESEGVMVRPDEDHHYFTHLSIVDDGSSVTVNAWGESVEISYGGFWNLGGDLSKPHTVAIGETKDGSDRLFSGSVAQFVIEDRFYDLGQYKTTNMLSSCKRPVEKIGPVSDTDIEEPFSCEESS